MGIFEMLRERKKNAIRCIVQRIEERGGVGVKLKKIIN